MTSRVGAVLAADLIGFLPTQARVPDSKVGVDLL